MPASGGPGGGLGQQLRSSFSSPDAPNVVFPGAAAGGMATGDTHHCCWPCVCDVEDMLVVDYVDGVVTRDGAPGGAPMAFLAMGDPCVDEAALHAPFTQPFYGRGETTLWREAPEVRCEGGRLRGATFKRNGLVAIGLFDEVSGVGGDNDDDNAVLALQGGGSSSGPLVVASPRPGRVTTSAAGVTFQSEGEFVNQCYDREQAGFNSGMGEIFRRVAKINPPKALVSRLAIAAPCATEGGKNGVCVE